MFAVGVETFAPYKVVWRRMGNVFRAALASLVTDSFLGRRMVIPSDTVSFVPFDDEDQALFFLGLLNSSPSRAAIYSFSPPGRGLGAPAILKQLNIGPFVRADTSLRSALVQSARAITRVCASQNPDSAALQTHLGTLDELAARYWRLSSTELAQCTENVRGIETTKSRPGSSTPGSLEGTGGLDATPSEIAKE